MLDESLIQKLQEKQMYLVQRRNTDLMLTGSGKALRLDDRDRPSR